MNYPTQTIKTALDYAAANPELHAEFLRRRASGDFFKKGEAVTKFANQYLKLNRIAMRAVGV